MSTKQFEIFTRKWIQGKKILALSCDTCTKKIKTSCDNIDEELANYDSPILVGGERLGLVTLLYQDFESSH